MEKTDLNKTWDRSCGTCRHSRMITNAVSSELQMICSRYPPRIETLVLPSPKGMEIRTITLWPEVKKTDVCGEYDRTLDS
jgi:hypothetical protein